MPPTTSTLGATAVISDDEMLRCVKLYRDAEATFGKLLEMKVNIHNEESIQLVNRQYELHDRMVQEFNSQCAGKQSRSSCLATKKRNMELGLVYQECD